jgi:hypothetical protein
MNILGHTSESLEKNFWFKILKFFDADEDPDPGIFLTLDPGWKKFASGINIPDPQHCRCANCNLDTVPYMQVIQALVNLVNEPEPEHPLRAALAGNRQFSVFGSGSVGPIYF